MIESLAGYQSPSMIADPATRESLNNFIADALEALSTPGSNVTDYFPDADVAIAGSGLDEYFMGRDAVHEGLKWVADLGVRWQPRLVVSWMRGDIAWAQIRIEGHKLEDGTPIVVPYVVTGVFQRTGDSWSWLYWGGGEPQQTPRL